ncbi:hypothetical protein D9757_001427 [Collybiopsis confluens]|uniref:Uncharacterized protein n=1 Tax=Collybiopsis confluens TaxID=2823264 RepID=A0A8H5MFV9_9AGAR|nr:hypothetical protein D9757_001427 [Collybiopsis confluens]
MHGYSARPHSPSSLPLRMAAKSKSRKTAATAQSDPDSDNEAPEALTLSSTKKIHASLAASLEALEAAQRQKKRDKNKERDRKLKEQAAQRVAVQGEEEEDMESDQEEIEVENDEIEARMLRAMEQAEEESSNEDDGDSDEEMEFDNENDKFKEEMLSASESDSDFPQASVNHLPDHIFASASLKPELPATTTPAISETKSSQPQQKKARRKRSGNAVKDIIIGSHTFRRLHSDSRASPSMAPSAKINKFLNRNLNLRPASSNRQSSDGTSLKVTRRGWERRAANLGSMKRQGPAAHFVRSVT